MVQPQRERRRSVSPAAWSRLSLVFTFSSHTFFSLFSEKSLATLKLARRNKVEDIKKKTNYYETRDLLERYEDGPARGLSPAFPKNGRVQHQQPPSTPQRATPAVPPNTPANSLATPISPGLQSQLIARMSSIQTLMSPCT